MRIDPESWLALSKLLDEWLDLPPESRAAWLDSLGPEYASILPQLRRCVLEMLEELPGRATGLGASELRILELISAGYVHPFEVFPHFKQRFQRRVGDLQLRRRQLDVVTERRCRGLVGGIVAHGNHQ